MRRCPLRGVPTGFRELNDLTGGLQGGQMIVIAARPAIGKSTLGLDIARAAAIGAGKASVIFSLEMSREEITKRMLSAESKVKLTKLTEDQAAYLGIPVDGPYKPDHYRY